MADIVRTGICHQYMIMPTDITHIDDDALILHLQLHGDIVTADLEALGKIGQEAVSAGPAYAIIDCTAITSLPRNLVNSALRANSLLALANHPNLRFAIFVQPDAAIRNMVDQIFRNIPYTVMGTVDAAVNRLTAEIIPNDRL